MAQNNGGRITGKGTRENLNKLARAAQMLARDLATQNGQTSADMSPSQARESAQWDGDAHERFMVKLRPYLERAAAGVTVEEKAAWTKIEGVKSGHKVYISKQKGTVKIECTLPPGAVGAGTEPDRHNGRIMSYLPDDPDVVGDAILLIGTMDERIPAPRRGPQQPDRSGKKY